MKRFKGTVVKGHGLGKKLGFPTINLELGTRNLDRGVIVVRVEMEGQKYWGVMHSGETIKGGFSCEVHILDYKGNAYGKEVSLEVREKLRETWKFENLDNLCDQIELDVEMAREKALDK